MFKTIANNIDAVLDLPENHYFIFGEMVTYLSTIPIWKLAVFYLYTFTYIKQREQGKEYRICLKWAIFPYKLRLKLLIVKLRNWF